MEVLILSGADADMDEIYAQIEGGGREDRFLHAMDRELELVRGFPRMVPITLLRKVRKKKIGRTPFGFFYTIEGRRLMVVAVQDLRKDPRAIVRIIRSRMECCVQASSPA